MSTRLPPLKGDAQGRYRILIVGNSGTGKTTVTARLRRLFNIPSLSRDEVLFDPGWVTVSREVFRERIRTFIESHDEWVMDGDAPVRAGSLPADTATDIIWLDPPFVLYFPRVFWRTIGRLLGWAEQCAPGCNETWRSVFWDRESILLWVITQHRPTRTRCAAGLVADSVELGGKWRRLGGWGSEAKRWFEQVDELAKTR
ncbi:hypothetical protein AURDEDRAFT_160495 [Auricularia subglabra TFB-10046 SS5]|nr:hypothetical protein AURDEDRAFT_160495 [Auricularia subglabra TFB-10046 SS5]